MNRYHQEFVEKILQKYNGEFIPLIPYSGGRKPMVYKHTLCGTVFERCWAEAAFKHNLTCPTCGGSNGSKYSTETFIAKLNSRGVGEFAATSEYTRINHPISIKCKKCGWQQTYSEAADLLRERFRGCIECNCLNKRDSHEQFLAKLPEDIINDYEILEKYRTEKDSIRIRHKECGKEYSPRARDLKDGHSHCPYCNCRGLSKGEKECLDYVQSLGFECLTKKRPLDGKEIDIWIPSKSFGIEFNGEYWHSAQKIPNDYHLKKLYAAKEKGITLFQVFNTEWRDKQEIVKAKIAAKLGIVKQKIRAKKCEIVLEKYANIKQFLNENHIQGAKTGCYYIAAKYEGEIVGVMVLSKGFRMAAKSGYLELSRFAVQRETLVHGLFSYIIKWIKKNLDIKGLFSFADLLIVDPENNVYLKNGFMEISRSKPDYKWYFRNKLFHKSHFSKSQIKKLFPEIYDPIRTEVSMMTELGGVQVYDCGKIKYELTF